MFDPLRKERNRRKSNEREEYKSDVRYQNRTEITLDCEEKNTVKGYFIFKFIFDTITPLEKADKSPLSKFKYIPLNLFR